MDEDNNFDLNNNHNIDQYISNNHNVNNADYHNADLNFNIDIADYDVDNNDGKYDLHIHKLLSHDYYPDNPQYNFNVPDNDDHHNNSDPICNVSDPSDDNTYYVCDRNCYSFKGLRDCLCGVWLAASSRSPASERVQRWSGNVNIRRRSVHEGFQRVLLLLQSEGS